MLHTSRIVCSDIFACSHPFDGHFEIDCQISYVQQALLSLISLMISAGNFKEQNILDTSIPALSVAQLIKFNAVKEKGSTARI